MHFTMKNIIFIFLTFIYIGLAAQEFPIATGS